MFRRVKILKMDDELMKTINSRLFDAVIEVHIGTFEKDSQYLSKFVTAGADLVIFYYSPL